MANFFIDRPIFAWVLAILLCLTGVLAITSLPVEQYPDLAPPQRAYHGELSWRLGTDAGKYRHAGYRAEHDGS